MPQQLQVLYFTFNPADHISGQQFPARDDFESNLAAAGLVDSQLDFPKRALAQDFDRLVLIQPLHVPPRGGRLYRRRIVAAIVGVEGIRSRRRRHGHACRVGARHGAGWWLLAWAIGILTIRREGDREVLVIKGGGHS